MKMVQSLLGAFLIDVRYRRADRPSRVHTNLAPLGLVPLLGLPSSRPDKQ